MLKQSTYLVRDKALLPLALIQRVDGNQAVSLGEGNLLDKSISRVIGVGQLRDQATHQRPGQAEMFFRRHIPADAEQILEDRFHRGFAQHENGGNDFLGPSQFDLSRCFTGQRAAHTQPEITVIIRGVVEHRLGNSLPPRMVYAV